MKHLRYLKYVALHKLYVFIAGFAMRGLDVPFLFRLVIHDLSKLRPSEWRPYATYFYSEPPSAWIERKAREIEVTQLTTIGVPGTTGARQLAEAAWGKEKAQRKARFDRAWLKHIHRNPHHWQYWLLQQDDGRRILLLPPADVIDEMVCDWIGAGTKILGWPTLAEAVAATVVWYIANREIIQLRTLARGRVEQRLHDLASQYGLMDMAFQFAEMQAVRELITVPGRRGPTA